MEDPYDMIPLQHRAERLCRMQDLIMQIEADYKRYKYLKQRVNAEIDDNSDLEELHRTAAWIKREMMAYRRLNAMSIEGFTCVGIGAFSSLSRLKSD